MRRGRIFLEPILHRTSTWALLHSHPLQGAVWGQPSIRLCSSHRSPGVPRIESSSAVPLNPSAFDHSSSAHYLLGTGPEPGQSVGRIISSPALQQLLKISKLVQVLTIINFEGKEYYINGYFFQCLVFQCIGFNMIQTYIKFWKHV